MCSNWWKGARAAETGCSAGNVPKGMGGRPRESTGASADLAATPLLNSTMWLHQKIRSQVEGVV